MAPSLAHRQAALYLSDPVAALTMVEPALIGRLPDRRVGARAALAADPDCPESVMNLLALDTITVARALVDNPHCTLSALGRVFDVQAPRWSGWRTDRLMIAILQAPATDAGLLRKMADGWPWLVVHHPLCPPDLLAELAQSPASSIRRRVARHPSTPDDALLSMIGDPASVVSVAVREALASRSLPVVRAALLRLGPTSRAKLVSSIPTELQRLLVNDSDRRVRYSIARATSDPTLLRDLVSDHHGTVRRAASGRVLTAMGA